MRMRDGKRFSSLFLLCGPLFRKIVACKTKSRYNKRGMGARSGIRSAEMRKQRRYEYGKTEVTSWKELSTACWRPMHTSSPWDRESTISSVTTRRHGPSIAGIRMFSSRRRWWRRLSVRLRCTATFASARRSLPTLRTSAGSRDPMWIS